MNRKAWLLAAAAFVAGTAQAACYTIYKADGSLLQETPTSPVDLQHQIGDTVPVKFGPGATMTISDGYYCPDRSGELSTQNSLAEAVRAEERKAMVLKAPAAKDAAASRGASAPVQVAKEESGKAQAAKEAPAKTQVMKQEGNVLTIKGKAAQ